MPSLVLRSSSAPTSTASATKVSNPTIIAGICVASVVAFSLALWLGIRTFRKRAQNKREDARGAAFLNVRGLVKEGSDSEKQDIPSGDVQAIQGSQFSRANLTSDVPMPAKAPLRPDANREEIIEYYATAGALPKPFSPFSFALAASSSSSSSPQPSSRDSLAFSIPSITVEGAGKEADHRSSWRSSIFNIGRGNRSSHLSIGSGSNHRMSVASTASASSSAQAGKRRVRQVFSPVLPDELVLSLGESVAILQSHDDGWCVIGRDSPFTKGETEIGACPAWCFVKPVKGLRAERPVRSTSLGVTVNLETSGYSSRQDIVSWSNF
ncbi:hypothetical protein PUNSTDRAFT_128082 [Punctularia strigosozonata HHB-11173 SS5]|uniref:SH3 domain-containing protein n=1 Tax=Punctularia strigosozonata (strain HHB-11173) TaxID=741275 RepID=R7S5P5_PUNST|nr:uncharacterized protein PUNSTDRAFT_128082 [Punctularia strigosozonata HHB-11173 SS5]EIN04826.1 hypothetical protein PUNSTDRAFT_128082 [Punctularia strigosozonata HHB-11173 SS5]